MGKSKKCPAISIPGILNSKRRYRNLPQTITSASPSKVDIGVIGQSDKVVRIPNFRLGIRYSKFDVAEALSGD